MFNKVFLSIICIPLVASFVPLNFHLTHWSNTTDHEVILYHHCLRVAITPIERDTSDKSVPAETIALCLSEWPSSRKNPWPKRFTFAQLSAEGISSEQLLRWSSSIDLAEDYQFYLNERSTPSAEQIFYNCSSQNFGPTCEYSFDWAHPFPSSLNKFLREFYIENEYRPTSLTCFVHVECDRGSALSCLDWSEVCDGVVDCRDGADEELCSPLELQQCDDDQRRCQNGQCIPTSFVRDHYHHPDCLDGSDEGYHPVFGTAQSQQLLEPTFAYEDLVCRILQSIYLDYFTRSCFSQRARLIFTGMFTPTDNSISPPCWSTFRCLLSLPNVDPTECDDLSDDTCPDLFFFPPGPILFGHIHFLYLKNNSIYTPQRAHLPDYLCYDDRRCFMSQLLDSDSFSFANLTCRSRENLDLELSHIPSWSPLSIETFIRFAFEQLYRCNTIVYRNASICSDGHMYQCRNSSKCISIDRLCDKLIDCDDEDDEECTSDTELTSLAHPPNLFYCSLDEQYIASIFVNNGQCDCEYDDDDLCEDEHSIVNEIRTRVVFGAICDGFTDLAPTIIDDEVHTDENECQSWACNNTYTRCNGYWNCFDGADEVDCPSTTPLTCPPRHHVCVSPHTNGLICLPIAKTNDGRIDCLGATDEPKLCRKNVTAQNPNRFFCKTNRSSDCISTLDLCNEYRKQCIAGEDLQFCDVKINSPFASLCYPFYQSQRNDAENFFCALLPDTMREIPFHFSIGSIDHSRQVIPPASPSRQWNVSPKGNCHRGVAVNVADDPMRMACLCPPSFYGDRCELQNERVSFTVQFQAFVDSQRTPFVVLVCLIEETDERTIHWCEQIVYLPIQDCQKKFNIYLLYSTRAKNRSRVYSIHIDIFEKLSLFYRGSLHVPVPFAFLPVQRIASLLYVPRTSDVRSECVDRRCLHGRCVHYANAGHGSSFCRCEWGWSGRFCHLPRGCSCARGSLCVGVLPNNRSICVCPRDRFGPRCLLHSTVCRSSSSNSICANHGQCVPLHEDVSAERNFHCICRQGFTGDRCEHADTKLIISFDQRMSLSQMMLVHFLRVTDEGPMENGTTFKLIPLLANEIVVFWTRPFHVVFVELAKRSYYLLLVQHSFEPSLTLRRTIRPSDRCPNIRELFNSTVVRLPRLRRVKYYQLACQHRSSLVSCFHDETFFCFCYEFGEQRLANCFEYNLTKKPDCFGRNHCENGGRCLQDSVQCPRSSVCLCPACFYGTRCQFRSSGFGHSLDALLGYHIVPHVGIWHQPIVVRVSAVLTVLMSIVGLVNSSVGIVTFQKKDLRTNGCALYLFASAVAGLITIFIFFLKFWILVAAQIAPITNRSFLRFQCLFIDLTLRIALSLDQWLNACVATEQAIAILRRKHFNREKSERVARYVTTAVVLFTIGTAIHEPFQQRLIEDGDEDEFRIWCIVHYSDNWQLYDSIINIFHFFVPFLINVIAALSIIVKLTRQYRLLERTQIHNRRQIRAQFEKQKEVLLTPILLVLFAAPSIIIYLVTNCVESIHESKTFLVGYFMSFSPAIFTFFLFILPSKFYKRQLTRVLLNVRIRLRIPLRRFFPE